MRTRAAWSQAMGLGPLWIARAADAAAEPLPETAASPNTLSDTSLTETPPPIEAPIIAAEPAPATLHETTDDYSAATVLTVPDPAQLPSWEAIQKEVETCQRCGLCQTRIHTVFGRGQPGAKWLLVGEAPGANEDQQGLAFVGRAGQLLDNMLGAIGLDGNTDAFITNVLKCRPPGNRNPTGDEIVACQHYLHAQIAHLQPTLILALGRFAAQTLLQTEQSISRLRGQRHHYQGIPLIVTFHPAYLLRNLPDKAKAWQDLVFASRTQRELNGQ